MGVRFAPSPTGPFHLGNLRTAYISWRLAKELHLPWVVRFEDIDKPRLIADAQDQQLDDMRELGLRPAQILLQSEFYDRHEKLFRLARDQGMAYPCTCSRKDLLEAVASAPHGGPAIYSGRCRHHPPAQNSKNPTIAWRFRNQDPSGRDDFIIGRTHHDDEHFSPAYNWSCAIDDFDGGYQVLVRCWDLDHVASLQRAVYDWLARRSGVTKPYPAIFHTALVTQNDGHRLEKRTRGVALAEVKSTLPVAQVVSLFEQSVKDVLWQISPSDLTGEPRKQITLAELGF